MSKIISGLVLAGVALTAGPALGQSGADFFEGRTVNYVVATDAGGGFDTYGRLVAEYMQKYLPGSTFVVRNMPGAGHMIGANFIYAAEPDGLTIGTFNTGLVYSQLSGHEGARFDLAEMSWIGKAASDSRIVMVSEQSGIATIEELMALETPARFGAGGIGSGSYVETLMLQQAAQVPIEIISGFNGNEDQLAMLRGEIQGVVAFRSSYQQFVDDGNGRFLAQMGGSDPELPDLADHIASEEGRQVAALIEAQGTIARLTAGPPGIPEDRLEALREAYGRALSDPELIARAAQLGLPVDPLVGDQLGEAIEAALDQSPEVVGLITQALAAR